MALVTVAETPAYIAKAESIMTAAERDGVIDLIAANPLLGKLIRGGHGIRKLRVGLDGRGKRGGGRVIYWFYNLSFPAVLLWAFAKNEASDLMPEQRKRLALVTKNLLNDFGVHQ